MTETFENLKNKIQRDSNGDIISFNGFKRGDFIVFDRSLGGYSDCIFRIDDYFELNSYYTTNRSYVEYDGGISPVDDFFSKGSRHATQTEINEYE